LVFVFFDGICIREMFYRFSIIDMEMGIAYVC